METSAFDKSLHGIAIWLLWNFGYILYLLCTGLPILFYIFCLFLMAIKRETSITLSIIMAVLINPLVSIPVGVTANTLGQYLSKKLSPKIFSDTVKQLISRIFTYSLNCHLTLIAGLIYYLFVIWINSDQSSDIDFNNKPYDQCTCDILTENNLPCENRETDSSFQNRVIRFSIPMFLQIFLALSISCHMIHALVLYIPSPLTLIDLILGLKQDGKSKTRANQKKRHLYKTSCCLLTIVYMIGIVSSPYYGFDLFLGSHENGNYKHYIRKMGIKIVHVIFFLFRYNMYDNR